MREREIFLDRLRIAATCAVVLLHVITGVMDRTDMGIYPFEKKVFTVTLALVNWCVPVFLLISGYLFLKPARKIGMREMAGKYARRILLALFLFGVPYACMEQVATEREFRRDMVGRSFLLVLRGKSWSHMWYLYLILLLYLLTPAIKWILERIPRAAVYVSLAVIFILCSIMPYAEKLFSLERLSPLPEETIYFFYYICGYLFAVRNEGKHGERTKKAKRSVRRMFCGVVLLTAGMAAVRLTGTAVQMGYNYPFTAALSLLLFGWGCAAESEGSGGQRGESARRKLLREQAAALSFAVYLVHPVFLNLAYKVFRITPLSFAVGVSLPVFWIGTLALSVLTAWILRKIPPLRKYVL